MSDVWSSGLKNARTIVSMKRSRISYGTHFVLPESMLRIALPIGLKFVMRFIFRSAKEHPNECEATRKDVDKRLSAALHEWITA